jgi:hypothetical protein
MAATIQRRIASHSELLEGGVRCLCNRSDDHAVNLIVASWRSRSLTGVSPLRQSWLACGPGGDRSGQPRAVPQPVHVRTYVLIGNAYSHIPAECRTVGMSERGNPVGGPPRLQVLQIATRSAQVAAGTAYCVP